MNVPGPAPKLNIVGETQAAQCRIAEDYTYIEQNTNKKRVVLEESSVAADRLRGHS